MISKSDLRKARAQKHNDHYLVQCGQLDQVKYKLTDMHGARGVITHVVEHPQPVRGMSIRELFQVADINTFINDPSTEVGR